MSNSLNSTSIDRSNAEKWRESSLDPCLFSIFYDDESEKDLSKNDQAGENLFSENAQINWKVNDDALKSFLHIHF
jgi:hypothetical protein